MDTTNQLQRAHTYIATYGGKKKKKDASEHVCPDEVFLSICQQHPSGIPPVVTGVGVPLKDLEHINLLLLLQ